MTMALECEEEKEMNLKKEEKQNASSKEGGVSVSLNAYGTPSCRDLMAEVAR